MGIVTFEHFYSVSNTQKDIHCLISAFLIEVLAGQNHLTFVIMKPWFELFVIL